MDQVTISGRNLTIVMGMHRSGTSLCANLLSLLGLDMADVISPHESNARGHWERWEIVEFHDRVLRHFGQDYYDPRHGRPLPIGWWAEPAVRCIRDELASWLQDRMGKTRRFGFKDPRTCRLLPMWREILADLELRPRFVVCLRDPAEVAHSLARRDKLTVADGAYRWLVYNTDMVNGLRDAPVAILPYEAWFTDPASNLAGLASLVDGIEPGDLGMWQLVNEVVDPALRHQRGQGGEGVPPLARTIYRMLTDCRAIGQFSPTLRTVAETFCASTELLRPLQDELDVLRQANAAMQEAHDQIHCEALTLRAGSDEARTQCATRCELAADSSPAAGEDAA